MLSPDSPTGLLQIVKAEGLSSLYRGYSAHLLAILFWMSVLPMATDFLMEKLPVMIDPK